MLFSISGKDYTKNIVVGTYDVNTSDKYYKWTDANMVEHRDIYRQQISGTFQLGFRNQSEFDQFAAWLKEHTESEGYCSIGIYSLNENTFKTLNAYVKMTASHVAVGTSIWTKTAKLEVVEA